ncbi:copper chaperone PCu(A)C [Hydrogenobaculum acidophilum]
MKRLLFIVGLLSGVALAKPDIVIKDPWVRLMPPTSKVSAAYMKIENKGNSKDVLLWAKSSVSKITQLHKTIKKNGLMKMIRIKYMLIKPNQTLVLKPGGYHIMLIDLKHPLKHGEKVTLWLKFKYSGIKKVVAPVEYR